MHVTFAPGTRFVALREIATTLCHAKASPSADHGEPLGGGRPHGWLTTIGRCASEQAEAPPERGGGSMSGPAMNGPGAGADQL